MTTAIPNISSVMEIEVEQGEDIFDMINERRGTRSLEFYAHDMGLGMSTLYKLLQQKGGRLMTIDTLRKITAYYKRIGDAEMVIALAKYGTGVEFTAYQMTID